MRRSLLSVLSLVVVLSVVVTASRTTTLKATTLPCPYCGTQATKINLLHDHAAYYQCTVCTRQYSGPARFEFSWMDAIEAWMCDVGILAQ